MPVPSSWHPGEIAAQQARGYEDAAWGGYEGYEEGAPHFMASFLCSLPFLSITTLDQHGVPWASLICNDGQTGFMQLESTDPTSRFKCTIRAPEGIPIRECLLRLQQEFRQGIEPYDEIGDAKPDFQVAAVGVMLHNRRRNKMQGVIVSIEEAPTKPDESRFIFRINVSNTFGNCPKYINIRQLVPVIEPQSTSSASNGEGSLPSDVLNILASADSIFLATKHSGSSNAYPADPPTLGNNIRGGPPGFLRSFFDKEAQRQVIVLPDWSGNRLMQSFGNMTNDPVAGITVPVWSKKGRNADLLHITCDALVLADEEASELLRGVKGAVKLWPRRWSLIHAALPLCEASDTIGWSPYNPPVRLLNSEKPSLGGLGTSRPTASLIGAHFWSPFIATFTFQVNAPFDCLPGQHIILDCFNLLDTRVQMYTHMAQYRGGEKDLNDDGTRSWTISYASTEQRQFEVTLRRKERGGVTPGLFRRGFQISEEGVKGGNQLVVDVLGIDGNCLLPLKDHPQKQTLHLAYFVAGIGITPLLPHLSQLAQSNVDQARVLVIAAVKWDEVEITKQLIRRALTRGCGGSIILHVRASLLAGVMPTEVEEDVGVMKEQDDVKLPSNITLEVNVKRGERLQAHSLLSHQVQVSESSGSDFVLPEEACLELKQASQVVICAANAFTRIATEALKQAGIAEDIVKTESFSF